MNSVSIILRVILNVGIWL